MGIRRQIYLEESDDRLLREKSRVTGLSISELIRQAIQSSYGTGQRLTWDEVFANPVKPNTARTETWNYDPLFDADYIDSIDREIDRSA